MEAFLTRIAPSVKTKITVFLGAAGNAAYYLKDYVAGLPLEKMVTVERLMLINAVLFTLAFWFKGMGERVAEREEDNA